MDQRYEGRDRAAAPTAGAPSLTGPVAPTATDGRLLRSQRTRTAIVDALLDLIKEGTLRPSSAQIADKAGVTQRTLFNQFGDMESLFEAVTKRHTSRVAHLLPSAGSGSLEQRVDRFCLELSELLDEVMNIRWAVLTTPEGLARFGRNVDLLNKVLRHQLTLAFEPELDRLDDENRERLLDVLEIEIDPLAWRLRRMQQGRTTEQARELVRMALLGLLRGWCLLP